MKLIYSCLFLLVVTTTFSCQQNADASKAGYDPTDIHKIFSNDLKSRLGIKYPLRKGYYNKDKSGEFYILITESDDGFVEGDSLHRNIKILKVAKKGNDFVSAGEINDHVNDGYENSIWVWTKYAEFKDIDQDGYIDPILVYGSSAILNGIDDGRLKIIIWYKNRKIVIRHQSGTLDDQRETQVDAAFYTLPVSLQAKVRSMTTRIQENAGVLFPFGWEKAMDKKRLKFNER